MGFGELLRSERVILLDGAMGTSLDERGWMGRGRVNLDAPDVVRDIHRAYARCGCNALIANTLTMNRLYIETHNVDVPVTDVNQMGVTLARQAADAGQYVLGDLGPTGRLLEPYGTFSEAQFYEAFKEQATALASAGVDGFIIETVFDLREALCALRACKENAALPVIVCMTFATEANGGRTIMGNTAEQCARQLTAAGADVVGANCGDLDPVQMARVIALFQEATDLPLVAQPNAGKPRLVEDRTLFDMDAKTFAAGIAACVDAGANLVGGCCGTTPEHIRAVGEMIRAREGC